MGETFAERIKKLRQENNWDQSELAERLGLAKSTVAMWEIGRRFPSKNVYEKLADLFNVDMDYLFCKTDVRKQVHYDEDGEAHYYLNPETARIAQEIFENSEMRALFDAASDIAPENLQLVYQMVLALKKKENGEDL